MRDRTGAITHFIGIKQDVSERKRTEEAARVAASALAASEERYRSLVDNLESLVFSLDVHGRLSYANPALSRLGFPLESARGRSFSDFFHEPDRAKVESLVQASVRGGVVSGDDLHLVDGHGRVRIVRTSMRPIHGGSAIVGVSGICDDVTVQREAEEKLRVAERLEAVGKLAGGVAHEFNNLLTVILSYIDVARSPGRGLDESLDADLGQIAEAARRAERLTQKLLAFSKKQVLLLAPLEVNGLLAELGSVVQRAVGDAIRVEVSTPRGAAWIHADRTQTEEFVLALAMHARQSMSGGGTVRLSVEPVAIAGARSVELDVPAGDYVAIAVEDDGATMSEDERAHAFEPYFRGGLELSTVYGIIRQTGGAIEIRPREGGNVVRVFLPAHAPVTSVRSQTVEALTSTESRGILVVEDEVALLRVLRRILTGSGWRVFEAASGEEALAAYGANADAIDLVLTDVIMPAMDGRELAGRLRERAKERGTSLPIVFMSGYADESIDSERGTLDGPFLRKPFDRETVTSVVRSALAAHLQAGDLPARSASR